MLNDLCNIWKELPDNFYIFVHYNDKKYYRTKDK